MDKIKLLKGIDWFFVALLLIGLFAFIIKVKIVYPIQWVGHADAADYAILADNVIHGKGLWVDFLGYSFWLSQLKYPEISQPEAHYPPLYPFLTIPFFLVLGKSAFAAKLPSLLISCFFLPSVLYALGKKLGGSRLVGFASGLSVLVFSKIFGDSLAALSDVLYASTVAATTLFLIKGFENPRYFYLMGIFIALSYYAKGSGLVLIPACLLFYLIRRQTAPKPGLGKAFSIGLLLTFLLLLPWMVRNIIHFGSPFFSTQQYAAGYIGYKTWEEGTYHLYWNEPMPSIFSKLSSNLNLVFSKTMEFLGQYFWWSFFDIDKKWGKLNLREYETYYTGIMALLGLSLLFLSAIYLKLMKLMKLMKGMKDGVKIPQILKNQLQVWYNPDLQAIWLVMIFLMSFLAVCWSPINRLAFPFVCLVIVTGWTTYWIILNQGFSRLSRSKVIVAVLFMVLMIPILQHSIRQIYQDYQKRGYPYKEGGQDWMEAGRWLKKNAPGSITMTRNPWELHFYSNQRAVQIPLAELDQVIKVMKYYKVTHIIPQVDIRPSLKPLVSGEKPGLELVYDKGLRLYKIRYDLLPK